MQKEAIGNLGWGNQNCLRNFTDWENLRAGWNDSSLSLTPVCEGNSILPVSIPLLCWDPQLCSAETLLPERYTALEWEHQEVENQHLPWHLLITHTVKQPTSFSFEFAAFPLLPLALIFTSFHIIKKSLCCDNFTQSSSLWSNLLTLGAHICPNCTKVYPQTAVLDFLSPVALYCSSCG